MRSFIATLSLFTLVACTPDGENADPVEQDPQDEAVEARFADASDADRKEAASAAMGMHSIYAIFAMFSTELDALEAENDDDPETNCPSAVLLQEDPFVIRYSADDCTASSGRTYDGTAEVTNLTFMGGILSGEEYTMSDSGPMSMEFEQFAISGDDGEEIFDGTFYQSEMMPAEGETSAAEMELSVTRAGRTVEIALYMETTDGRGEMLPGSEATIEGLGHFTMSGSFSLVDGLGEIVLTGADEMRISVEPDEAGCYPVTIGGVAGQPLCADETEEI